MIKVSKSFNDIDNKKLLDFFSDHAHSFKTNNKCIDKTTDKDSITIDIDENLDDFEQILSFQKMILKEPENDRREMNENNIKNNNEELFTISKNNFKNKKLDICWNINRKCSICNRSFENNEQYYEISHNNETLCLDSNCFKCEFCEGPINKYYVLKNSTQNSQNIQFYHFNCYKGQTHNLLCFACRAEIIDTSYLIISDLTYHLSCIKCQKCNAYLKDETKVNQFMSKFYCLQCV